MSDITTAVKCDGPECKATSMDYFADGWLAVLGKVIKYRGRAKDGCAKTETYVSRQGTMDAHFCSWRCLQKTTQG